MTFARTNMAATCDHRDTCFLHGHSTRFGIKGTRRIGENDSRKQKECSPRFVESLLPRGSVVCLSISTFPTAFPSPPISLLSLRWSWTSFPSLFSGPSSRRNRRDRPWRNDSRDATRDYPSEKRFFPQRGSTRKSFNTEWSIAGTAAVHMDLSWPEVTGVTTKSMEYPNASLFSTKHTFHGQK